MQSAQVSEDKSYENQNADLERILKNITESPTFHGYVEKLPSYEDRGPGTQHGNSAEDNLSCILIGAVCTKDLKFIRYILESLEIYSKTIINKTQEYCDFPIFMVFENFGQYPRSIENIEQSVQNEKNILSLLLRYGAEINSRAAEMIIHLEWSGDTSVHGSLAFYAMMKGNLELLNFILDKCDQMNMEERKYMMSAIYSKKEWSIVSLLLYMRRVIQESAYIRNKNTFEMAAMLYKFYPESFRMNSYMWFEWHENNRGNKKITTDLYFYISFLMTDPILSLAEMCLSDYPSYERFSKEEIIQSVRDASDKFNCVTGFNDVDLDIKKLTQFLDKSHEEEGNEFVMYPPMDPALAISHMPKKYAAQFLENIIATQDAEIILKAVSQFKKHQSYNEILEECADSIWNFLVSLDNEKLNDYIKTVIRIIDQFCILRWQAESKESLDGSNARLDDLGSLIAKMIFMASARYEELESDYLLNLKTLLRSYIRMGGDPENVVCGEWESNNQLRAINKNFNSHASEVWVESLSKIPDEYYFLMFCRSQLDSLIYYVDQIKLAAVINRDICNKIESFGSLLHDQSRRPSDVLQDVSELWCSLRENLECYVLSTKDSRVSFFKGTEDNIALVLESIDAIFAHYQVKMGVQLLPHQSMK